LTSVVFPAPVAPSIATVCPASIARLLPASFAVDSVLFHILAQPFSTQPLSDCFSADNNGLLFCKPFSQMTEIKSTVLVPRPLNYLFLQVI
jgi:hypothetical protein